MRTRSLLRNVLSTYIDTAPAEVNLRARDSGKPYIDNGRGVTFNVAHTGDVALIGVTRDAEIGVDVEYCDRPLANPERLARFRLFPTEYERLQHLSGDDMRESLLELWTQKEAFVKCTGEGVARSLRSFEIGLDKLGHPTIAIVDGCAESARRWCIRTFKAHVSQKCTYSSVVIETQELKRLSIFDL